MTRFELNFFALASFKWETFGSPLFTVQTTYDVIEMIKLRKLVSSLRNIISYSLFIVFK